MNLMISAGTAEIIKPRNAKELKENCYEKFWVVYIYMP